MHEFAIGQKIVKAALAEYSALQPVPARLKSVRVISGALHQIVPDALQTAYELLCKETDAEGSTLTLKVKPVIGGCKACGWRGEIQLPFFRCSACESLQIEVIEGQELYIDGLEVEFDE